MKKTIADYQAEAKALNAGVQLIPSDIQTWEIKLTEAMRDKDDFEQRLSIANESVKNLKKLINNNIKMARIAKRDIRNLKYKRDIEIPRKLSYIERRIKALSEPSPNTIVNEKRKQDKKERSDEKGIELLADLTEQS